MNGLWRSLPALLLLGALAGPARADAPADSVWQVRSELGARTLSPGQGEWRGRLQLAGGPWSLQGAGRRRDGEPGLLPHAAGGLVWAGPRGWRVILGDQQPTGDLHAALGRGRGGLPGRVRGGLGLGPGALSTQSPGERGLSLEQCRGALRGGLLLASNRRDLRADGAGFLLDLEHAEDNRRRWGAWRDRLVLGWGTWEGPAGWDLHGLAGRRSAVSGGGSLLGLQAIRRRPERQLALAWEAGENRLLQCQAVWLKGRSTLQADVWRGWRGSSVFARPALPAGWREWGGGLALQARRGGRQLAGTLSLRWLDAQARGPERSACWGSLELDRLPGPAGSGLAWSVRHSLAEDRPSGAGREEWRLRLRPLKARPLDWELSWQQARGAAGVVRWWQLGLARGWRRPRYSHGLQLQVLAAVGSGPARLVPLTAGPGLLRYGALTGSRQLCAAGWWGRRGAHLLSVGWLLKEVEDESGAVGPAPLLQVRWVCAPGS
ncbi:MAG: hypothetical protein WC326_12690 [Candidatus Delongbacteria bacterium]